MQQIFLKFEGGDTSIEGESRDDRHHKWVEADTWFHDMTLACSQGDTFRKVTIAFYRASGREPVKYLEIVLNRTIVSHVSSRVKGAGLPREVFSLKYASVKWIYTAQAIDGHKRGIHPQLWSLAKNKATEAV
jgi:type VI secretion system secreted protein Hcp